MIGAMAQRAGAQRTAVEPITRTPLYREVLARLEQLVAGGGLEPGDRLPPERELAVQLGISRNSLRPALAALEAKGLIEIRHGAGTFLRATSVAQAADTLAVVLAEQSRQLPAAMEARLALERFAAGVAADRRDDADLERLEAALEQMAREVDGGEAGDDGDRRFHAAVVAAAHNPVLAALAGELADPVDRIRIESLAQHGRPQRSLEDHRRILAAIRAGDARAAVAEMDRHLGRVADTLLVRSAERGAWPASD
jgi:GntR family transcriptional repressor for pyruvate dehydrogenase complex